MSLSSPRRRIVRDLTRVRHMTTVSAVVLGTTFMPLLGLPDMYELRALQGAVEGFSDARAHVLTPRRNDEAARERSSRTVIRERRDRGLALPWRPDPVLTVERPARAEGETLDAALSDVELAPLPPLPPLADSELAAPGEQGEQAQGAAETGPQAPPAEVQTEAPEQAAPVESGEPAETEGPAPRAAQE